MPRSLMQRIAETVVVALVTAVVQWALYAVSLRQDMQLLTRDVGSLNCKVAILSQDVTLPDGCHPRIEIMGAPRVTRSP